MVAPRLSPATVPPRRQTAFWLVFGAIIALAGQQVWQRFAPEKQGDPLAISLHAFEKQNRLTVFSAQLSPVVTSEDERLMGVLKSRQVAVIPARVDYTLDLAKLDASAMRWNEEQRSLSVTLPPLELSRPNLDEGRAQYLREGVWITREAQAKLTRDNTVVAEKLAAEEAGNTVLMGLARESARQGVRQNLAIPLQVAGFGDVKVEVRFAGE
ncbi:DUF4230 domain-containing protein [Novosphingobium sp. TH158]|uniref:DUF4230 domain-containing protein n=1 Tax=Novosphingobium sp. TH158 TaxID=2067455 RepID=UPI000C7DC940|nr:DUF4230 domain-containing protein [Novosphingobium sp. TH158]PLK26893.1 hypothetical protein C0V78_08320 [Novosphingobium sp. TH158]